MKNFRTDYDIIVLGSGIAGSASASILSKLGFRTLMVDKSVHPRFALGESTIGETSFLLRILSARYDIPELGYVSSSRAIQQGISKNCGIKRNFGFVYQRENMIHEPFEVTQCNVSEGDYGPESHLLREDIDTYLFETAKKYGTDTLEGVSITNVDFNTEGAEVHLSDTTKYTASYIIDATGRHSVLANQFSLREEPCRFQTNSRTLFTHMTNVKPYDQVNQPSGQPTSWHEGTLHHLFDGGWLWVIPFDNHSESNCKRVSIGLNLDGLDHPYDETISPEEEWNRFLERFPSIAKQFDEADMVFPWVRTKRTQYSSKKTIGDRWILMNHAAGAIDAMFSRGLANSMAVIEALIPKLVNAFENKSFSETHFQDIEKLNQNILDNNDLLIAGSYISFRDFNLWRAWSKVWFLMWNLGVMRYAGSYYKFLESGNSEILDKLHDAGNPGAFCPEIEEAEEQFKRCYSVMVQVKANKVSPESAVEQLADILGTGKASLAPLNLNDVMRRWHDGSEEAQKNLYQWGKTESPQEIRHFFDYDFSTVKKAAEELVSPILA